MQKSSKLKTKHEIVKTNAKQIHKRTVLVFQFETKMVSGVNARDRSLREVVMANRGKMKHFSFEKTVVERRVREKSRIYKVGKEQSRMMK